MAAVLDPRGHGRLSAARRTRGAYARPGLDFRARTAILPALRDDAASSKPPPRNSTDSATTPPVRRSTPDTGRGRSSFPPIADYAFLSDCETVALVAPSGAIEWMCLPRVDSPSVFGAMLDRDAGWFRLGPDDASVPAAGATCRAPWCWRRAGAPAGLDHRPRRAADRAVAPRATTAPTRTAARPPTTTPTTSCCARSAASTARCSSLLDCEPKFDYGRDPARWRYTGEGYNEGVAGSSDGCGRAQADHRPAARLRGLAGHRPAPAEGGRARVYCALSWGEHAPPADIDEAYERLVWTAHHWQHWLDRGNFPDHPWRTYLQRSALTLKGLTYAPTGALLAAATTSLPETPQGERNWDYRYSWIRDSTFMLWALLSLGFDWEANDFFYFIADVAAGEENLQVMYGIGGERELDEHVLDHLDGYEGARPVRIGNAAYEQEQHDVWGALLDSVYLHTRSRDSLDERVWPILARQVEEAIEHWREPDRGIWEVRGEPKHFTSSKMFCWVACDRGARLAELRED